MSFPQLHNWKETISALHQAVLLLGTIQHALLGTREAYLHYNLYVDRDGIRSQRFPQGGEIRLDFRNAALRYLRAGGDVVEFPLADYSQAALLHELLVILQQDELASFLADIDPANQAAGMVTKLYSDASYLPELTHGEPLSLDKQTAAAYADVLNSVYTGIARFRGRLRGHMSSMVVWPEHFDLSTLWFVPANSVLDESKAHMNFGFSPYTPGQYEYPYLYAYVYPYPEPFTPPPLPEPAFWNPEGWRGVAVNYADIAAQPAPEFFVEQMCEQLFGVLRSLLVA